MTFLQPPGWRRPKGYSNGVLATGRMVFVSGQVGWDQNEVFQTQDLVGQVRQSLANIVAVLEQAGGRPSDLVRLTWFVLSRDAYHRELKEIGAAYVAVLGKHFPTMSVVQVSGLMEAEALVEIEATAVIADEDSDATVKLPAHGHLASA